MMLALVAALCWLQTGQDRIAQFSDVRGNVLAGVVVDANGQPVDGALVRVAVIRPTTLFNGDALGSADFRLAALQALRACPLPEGCSGADGMFRIQLTVAQRRLGVLCGPPLELRVEKDGFAPWHGPIGTCPGRIGALRVELARVRAVAQRGRLVPPQGFPGSLAGWLGVTTDYNNRNAGFKAAHFSQLVPIAADGTFVLPAAPEDGPFVHPESDADLITTRGFHLRPRVPGLQGNLTWHAADRETYELRPAVERAPTRVVRCTPGATPPATIDVGYRTVYAHMTWRLPFGPVPVPEGLTLAWVGAEGFCTTLASNADIALRPLPERDVTLSITGVGKEQVTAAEYEILETGDWLWPTGGSIQGDVGGRRASQVHEAKGGAMTVPRAAFAHPSRLCVRAVGFAPCSADLASFAAGTQVVLSPVATGRVTIRVQDGGGRPVARAAVLFSDSAYLGGSLLGAPPTTDATGTLTARLPVGEHRVAIYQEGFARDQVGFTVAAHEDVAFARTLEPERTCFVRVRDESGRPVPWLWLSCDTGEEEAARAGLLPRAHDIVQWVITDREGRARFDGFGREASLGLRTRFPPATPPALADGVTEVQIPARNLARVDLRFRDAQDTLNLHWTTAEGDTGNCMGSGYGARDFRVWVAATGKTRATFALGGAPLVALDVDPKSPATADLREPASRPAR